MLLERVLTTVNADYSQYRVADHDAPIDPEFTTGGTGLIGPQGDVAVVVTGTQYGPVRLTVETHDAPPDLDLDSWDEVVDVSFDLPGARLIILTLMSGPAAVIDLNSQGGAHWLRVQARGRDEARDARNDDDDGEPVEEHLIAVWPAGRAPRRPHAIVHKATDAVGAYYRQSEEETKSRTRPLSTVEFRTSPAQWSIPPWVQWPDDPGVVLPFEESLLRSARLDLSVTSVTVYPTGCLIDFTVHVRRSDLDQSGWERVTDVARHGFGFPGHSLRLPLHPEALRVSVAWPGQSPVFSARAWDGEGPPDGPTVVGYPHGGTSTRDDVVERLRAWLWPRPPTQPLLISIQWPALDLALTTVTLDDPRIVADQSAG